MSAAPADARAAAGGLNFTWRVARRGDDGSFGVVALLTLTGLHALNLVVAAGQLAPGATYRFTLEARTGAGVARNTPLLRNTPLSGNAIAPSKWSSKGCRPNVAGGEGTSSAKPDWATKYG